MTGARALLDEPWLVALGWLVILSLLTTTLPALALAEWRLVRPRASALNQHRAAFGAFVSAAIVGLIALPLLLVAPAGSEGVTVDVAVDGLPSPMALTSAAGGVATLQLAGGRTLGIVPTVSVNGVVAIALHDMSTTPHRLIGTRTLQPGATARFEEASPVVSVSLARY